MDINIVMRKYSCIWLLLCLTLGVTTVLLDAKNEVTVQVLKRQNFNHELVSNGKVNAQNKAELHFETSEVIIYVKNAFARNDIKEKKWYV